MSINSPERLRTYLIGHALIAATFVGGFYLLLIRSGQEGSDIAARQATLERTQPTLVLVGNSLLRAAVNADQFSELSGMKTIAAQSDGSSSLWWYLYIKNVASQTKHKPRYLGIVFRDTFLTEPTFRVDGLYQKPIRRLMSGSEPLVQELSYQETGLNDINSPLTWIPREARNWLNYKIEKRVEDIVHAQRGQGRAALKCVFAEQNMVPGLYNEFQLGYEETSNPASYDFDRVVERSYLPRILDLLRDSGITPVLIRSKRRRDLDPNAEPAPLKQYIAKLERYVTQRGALWIDFTGVEQIRLEHFGAGDHLTATEGRRIFMRLLAEDLRPRIARAGI